jgi:DNA phosphorothioation-dependent restriction protein DptG
MDKHSSLYRFLDISELWRRNMASRHNNTKDSLSDMQFLVMELEKASPDSKIIKSLTTKYGIPYKSKVSEQLDELLSYLNRLSVSDESKIT